MPRYSLKEKSLMFLQYEAGESVNNIAANYQCSPTTVYTVLDEFGAERRNDHQRIRLKHRYGTWRRSIASNGYVVWSAWDSEKQKPKFLLEHRIIMSWILGRELVEGENVHHKDGNRKNNDPSNLELWITQHPAGMSHCPNCGLSLTKTNLS